MRKDKKLYVASFCGLGLTVMSGMALSRVPEGALAVDSVEKSVLASVTVATACSMNGVETAAHTKTMQPGNYVTGIGSTTLTVTCNDHAGFSVYAVGFSGDTWGNTKMLYNGTGSDWDIATGTATGGNTSNWAMKLTSVAGTYAPTIETGYANYHAVPSDAAKVASYPSVTNVVDGSKMTTTYAAFVSSAQVAGTYEGQVKYILVNPTGANKPENPDAAEDLSSIATMQEMTASICAATTIGDTAELTDTRDGKTYTVAKLADGNCWMTQNLALGGTEPIDLTPDDTNITSDWTLPASVDTDDWWTVVDSYHNPEFYAWSEYEDDSETKYGNYYNWTTAIAMDDSSSLNSDDDIATTSICPKGWRLPTGGSDGEFMALMSEYDSPSVFTTEPLSFVFSGYYYNGVNDQGYHGNWWSSTATGNIGASYLTVNNGGSDSNNYRDFGYSVRCVAGS